MPEGKDGQINIKRWLVVILLVAMLALSACESENNRQTTPTAAPTQTVAAVSPSAAPDPPPVQATTAGVRIDFITQEYLGNTVAEIPYFAYDGEKNEALDAINRLFNQGPQRRYEEFLESAGEGEWVEIRAYPFTDDQYAQVVVTHCESSDAQGGGTVESVNYDKWNDQWIQYTDLGISDDHLLQEILRLDAPELEGASIERFRVAGFLLRPQGGEIGEFTEIYLEITTSDAPLRFYAFCPDTSEFYEFDPLAAMPFSHMDMDSMDPPLYYERFEEQTGGEPIADGVIYTGSLLESDSGENRSPYDAARALYEFVLRIAPDSGSAYSAEDPLYILCVDLLEIGGEECYLLEVSGSFGTATYAVNYSYADGSVYEIVDGTPQRLGSIPGS